MRRRHDRAGARLDAARSGRLVDASVLVFLVCRSLIVVPMSFSTAKSLHFPPPGFSLRWYETFFGDARWLDASGTRLLRRLVERPGAGPRHLAAYGLRRGIVRAASG